MGLADELAGRRVIEPSGPAGLADVGRAGASSAEAAAGVDARRRGRPGDEGQHAEALLVVHPPGAHRPPLVHVTDPVGVGNAHVGEELLAELARPIEHLDAVDLDARLVEAHHEHGEAAMLRHVPVRPREAQAPVRPPRAGRPDLRPVEHPLVAVAHGSGLGAGDIGSTRRFGQELHPDLLAAEDGRKVPALLLLGSEVEDQSGARLQRGNLEASRVLVQPDLLVERVLVSRRQALASVLFRKADPREPGVEQPALQLPMMCDLRELFVVVSPDWAIVIPAPGRSARGMLSASHVRSRPRKFSTDSTLALSHCASSFFSNRVVSRWR